MGLEQALEIDPGSVDARIGVAAILVVTLANGWSNSVQQDQARAELLLLEAVEGDPRRSMAHFALGILRRFQNRLTNRGSSTRQQSASTTITPEPFINLV